MKMNIEIDCTPAEAREFLGLPDVREMQSRFMNTLEERLMASITAASPEALVRSWFPLDTQWLQGLAARAFEGGFGTSKNERA